MDKLSLTESPCHQFSTDEIMELERTYQEMGERALDQNFCQEITMSFSSSSDCVGKTSLSWQQVQRWFHDKQKDSQANVTSSLDELKLIVDLSDASNEHKSFPTPEGKQVTDLSDLAYEARSSKDLAWHDVSLFLNYRVLSTGGLTQSLLGERHTSIRCCVLACYSSAISITQLKEARVRYAGFGKEQDEWVNVKEGIRERSIPLVPSECHKVKDGDLVLCFLETDDFALYCDARVIKIQRRAHDQTKCSCIFNIRFLHDNTEEVVSWERLCRRPTQEGPVVSEIPTNPIESLWG